MLAVPASSVPSERVASVAGNIVNPRRARLTPDRVELLTFARMNWHLVHLSFQDRLQQTDCIIERSMGVIEQALS